MTTQNARILFWGKNFFQATNLKQNEAQSARAESTHKGVNWRSNLEDVPLGEFMYLVFTRMPGESYRRRLRSLLVCLTHSGLCTCITYF